MTKIPIDLQSRLGETEQRVMESLAPFQRATVEHVARIYESGRKRVLVADEVGLGKTLVARGVIAKIACLRKREGADLVKIAYICSNGAIAAQNIEKLSIDGDVKLASSDASRLSMQHLALAKERGDGELRRSYIQITPLTPSTSFSITKGTGTMYERALMLAVLSYDDRFGKESGRYGRLSDILWDYHQGYSEGNWHWWRDVRAASEVAEARKGDPAKGDHEGYPFDVLEKVDIELEKGGRTTLSGIAEYIDESDRARSLERDIIVDLRKAFSKACVSMLDFDFVVMDEFQRFHELITDSDTETALLAKRFLNDSTRVLLLSATPYRMYSTAAELDDGGFGDSYREFLEVMAFLNDDDEGCGREFEEIWGSYTASLQRLSSGSCDIVAIRESKRPAEDFARRSIARTERQSTGELGLITDGHSHARELEVSRGDVLSYVKMSKLADDAGIPRGLFNVDFVKSCPFPLSFMGRYKFMKILLREVENNPDLVKADKKQDDGFLWLRRWDISSYKRLRAGNARFSAFMKDFDSPGLKPEQLLWVPATRPYYSVSKGSPFARTEGFSKYLLFSAWSMVPPSLATLMSYELERRNVRTLEAVTGKSYRYFKDGEVESEGEDRDDQALPHRRMRFDAEQRNAFLLLYPSPYLAGLIDVAVLANEKTSLTAVRRLLRERISADLACALNIGRLPKFSESSARQAVDWYIMAALKLDEVRGNDVLSSLLADSNGAFVSLAESYGVECRVLREIQEEYASWDFGDYGRCPADLIDVLVDAAIGSAAVCSLRCYGRMVAEVPPVLPFEFGRAFLSRMNTASSTLVVAAAMEGRDNRGAHWKNMLAYGCEGNLQAVIDEYAHVSKPVSAELTPGDLLFRMHRAMVGDGDSPSCHGAEAWHWVQVPNSGNAKERIGRMGLRTNIASAFMDSSSRKSGDDVVSRMRIRNAFNSPFRPFVLISTSIGQEGLDFHQYCRKICHWNLPSNPIDLEQREGRVNRYKGLAVRQSVSARYGDSEFGEGPLWDQLFAIAESRERAIECGEDSSGLLPFWGVAENGPVAKVERYVYLYPFSRDAMRYERLVEEVYRYRAVIGMPDQEELLSKLKDVMVAGGLAEVDIRGLFLNLCPYAWRECHGGGQG